MTFPARQIRTATVFDHPEFSGHERVLHIRDEKSGLYGIIAVHDTTAGPALGGCRMFPYDSEEAALRDVLRLSRGMTFKNVLAGLSLGGGKSVIIGDPRAGKSEALLKAFGRAMNDLGGRYITAEDSGTCVADMDIMAEETAHVRGTSGSGIGDPSPYTALGVFEGIKAAVRFRFGTDELKGRKVVVQGLGNTGYRLCELLFEAGCNLVVSDIRKNTIARAQGEFGAVAVPPNAVHRADADVFAPCALGACLNETTIPEISAPVIAGSANNQLATAEDGRRLKDRGILYAPDYAINAGGVIAIALGQSASSVSEVTEKVTGIGETLTGIFRLSKEDGRPESEIADAMAMARLKALKEEPVAI